MFIGGSVTFVFAAFLNALSITTMRLTFTKWAVAACSIYEFGGIFFVIGSVCFMPSSTGCNDSMEILGAWCFVIGSAFYTIGGLMELMMTVALLHLKEEEEAMAKSLCDLELPAGNLLAGGAQVEPDMEPMEGDHVLCVCKLPEPLNIKCEACENRYNSIVSVHEHKEPIPDTGGSAKCSSWRSVMSQEQKEEVTKARQTASELGLLSIFVKAIQRNPRDSLRGPFESPSNACSAFTGAWLEAI